MLRRACLLAGKEKPAVADLQPCRGQNVANSPPFCGEKGAERRFFGVLSGWHGFWDIAQARRREIIKKFVTEKREYATLVLVGENRVVF